VKYIQNESQTPPWEKRLKKRIGELRKDIGRVQRPKIAIPVEDCKNISAGYRKKNIYTPNTTQNIAHITEILDTLKHRLSVKAQWLGLYEEANG